MNHVLLPLTEWSAHIVTPDICIVKRCGRTTEDTPTNHDASVLESICRLNVSGKQNVSGATTANCPFRRMQACTVRLLKSELDRVRK